MKQKKSVRRCCFLYKEMKYGKCLKEQELINFFFFLQLPMSISFCLNIKIGKKISYMPFAIENDIGKAEHHNEFHFIFLFFITSIFIFNAFYNFYFSIIVSFFLFDLLIQLFLLCVKVSLYI